MDCFSAMYMLMINGFFGCIQHLKDFLLEFGTLVDFSVLMSSLVNVRVVIGLWCQGLVTWTFL